MIVPVDQVADKLFDYVIIGGGASGLTLAVRLSEEPFVSVLVIEAGEANLDDPAILAPSRLGSHLGNPKYDWSFKTVPQASLGGREVPFNRGKGLGGSSAINFLLYHIPDKSDINAFEELGNKGWNWDVLQHYYRKSEAFAPPTDEHPARAYELPSHGSNGPLTVAYGKTVSNFELPFQQTMKTLGVDPNKDPTTGTWLSPATIDPQKRLRSYAANKYYQPNSSRTNLTVIVSSHVTKIVNEIDGDGRATAVGVQFKCEEGTFSVRVGKEVVVSAGTLELSGIGDKDILRAAGVEVLVDLPGVGSNVQEHVFAGVTSELRDDVVADHLTLDMLRDPEELVRQSEIYEASGGGVLGMVISSMAFLPLSALDPDKYSAREAGITQLVAERAASKAGSPGLHKQHQIQLAHLASREPSCEFILGPRSTAIPNPPVLGKHYLTLSAFVNHPLSRGTIHIKSKDALVHPSIDPHYFEEEFDLVSFVEQIKYCRRVLNQEPLKGLLAGTELNPGPNVQSDDEIAEYLKSAFSSTWHTVGSCSMLPLSDGGVVDNNLKVYHTNNIRVVDVSVTPLHIGAHLQATAYALGELGADILKGKNMSDG
ncbi:alcohol oxidase [Mycena filopes]|nr:alcohol oxidase [Mycena filopes]